MADGLSSREGKIVKLIKIILSLHSIKLIFISALVLIFMAMTNSNRSLDNHQERRVILETNTPYASVVAEIVERRISFGLY